MIELLTSFSIAYNDKAMSELPTENQISPFFSISQIQFAERNLPSEDAIIDCFALCSAPYPIQGGEAATQLKNMNTKILKIGR